MANVYHPLRQNAEAALRQLELEEQEYTEISEREARRMLYRPPSYFHVNLFAYTFTLLGMAAVGACILARWIGWVK